MSSPALSLSEEGSPDRTDPDVEAEPSSDPEQAWAIEFAEEGQRQSELIAKYSGKASEAAGANDLDGLKVACASLRSTVAVFAKGDMAEDPRAMRTYHLMLDLCEEGASQCVLGDLEAAGVNLAAGTRAMQEMTAAIQAMS